MTFTETCEAIKTMSADWPSCNAKLVEDAANGPAIMDHLQDDIGGFIPVHPLGGKEARAHAASPTVQAGNVYLPHPEVYPWVKEFIHVITSFPAGSIDDPVDSMTQLINHVRESPSGILEAMTR